MESTLLSCFYVEESGVGIKWWLIAISVAWQSESTTTTTTIYGWLNFVRSTWVSRYQKGKTKTNLDFPEQETASGSGISWAICKDICTLTQTHNHASTPPLIFYRPDSLPTVSKHWRQWNLKAKFRKFVGQLKIWITSLMKTCIMCIYVNMLLKRVKISNLFIVRLQGCV